MKSEVTWVNEGEGEGVGAGIDGARCSQCLKALWVDKGPGLGYESGHCYLCPYCLYWLDSSYARSEYSAFDLYAAGFMGSGEMEWLGDYAQFPTLRLMANMFGHSWAGRC